jgi:hypothetical protein
MMLPWDLEDWLTDTGADASNGSVPIITALTRRLAKYRARLAARPQPEAPIFAATKGQALRLNNVLRSEVLPMLNRCGECRAAEDGHVGADHEYRRDDSLPAWHGWHVFGGGWRRTYTTWVSTTTPSRRSSATA